jgi:2'-5' RNA ligase
VSGPTARLFVSLELSSVVRSALADWASAVGPERSGLRLLRADALHLTLCFLGARPVGEIEAIAGTCAEAVQAPASRLSAAAISLTLGRARWLPPQRPRVLAVDLQDEDGDLGRLQQALVERLAESGWYTPERRAYLAHVTVARAGRSAARSGARPDALAPPEPLAFTADSVALMRSHLGPGGSRYERLASFRLGE